MSINKSLISIAFPTLSSPADFSSDHLLSRESVSSASTVSLSSIASLDTSPIDDFTESYPYGLVNDEFTHPIMNNSVNETCNSMDITHFNFSSYDFPQEQDTLTPFTYIEYIKIIVTVIVILVALAGNLGIIIAVSFNRTLRTTINLYLVNLAVADILICSLCMTVYLINQLTEPQFILGPVVCKLNAFVQSKYYIYKLFVFTFLSRYNWTNLWWQNLDLSWQTQ